MNAPRPETLAPMPPSVPELLSECHRLRRHLRDLQSEADLGPRVQKVQEKALEAAKSAHAAAHDHVKRTRLKQKEDEGALKQTETRLGKLRVDVNSAGSKKEYDLKLHEIEMATKSQSDLEDAILGAISEVEERTAELPAVESTWQAAQDEFARLRAEAAERLERLKADQVASAAKLEATEAQLPADVKPLYVRLVRQYGPDALAGVHGRTCQQCRTTITDEARSQLARGSFLCCTQCGRGLYPAGG